MDENQTPLPTYDGESPQQPPESLRRQLSRSTLIVVLCAVALVALPVLWGAFSGEVANWHEAAALEAYLNGDLTTAIRHMDTAIEKDSLNDRRLIVRAEYRRLTGDLAGSLEDCDKAILASDSIGNRLFRTQVLLEIGLYEKAIEEAKRINHEQNGANVTLNNLAYFRAVGNLELEEAAQDIETAITRSAGDVDAQVTTDEDDKGIIDLSKSTKGELKRSLVYDVFRGSDFVGQVVITKKKEQSSQARVVWTTRHGPIRNGDKIRPDFDATYLDTRGYISYLRNDLESARRDLDLAVAKFTHQYQNYFGAQGSVRHTLIDFRYGALVDLRDVELRKKEMARAVAVLRYHRALVMEKLGEPELAEKDYKRIRQLGFVPDSKLF